MRATYSREGDVLTGKGMAGTNPQRVLLAAQMFFREEFALKHRYVMALHTDELHPHVHVVLKAISEQGRRLNLRKATLKEWRAKFAAHLRKQGVAANAATPRRLPDQPVRSIVPAGRGNAGLLSG